MKYDVILSGVGGQGVLSVAQIITKAAVEEGLNVRQSEVHGMSQRGGAVIAHLRISDKTVCADLVPRGGADLILSMEPLEALRYAAWLKPDGAMVSAAEPMVNITNYPDLDGIIKVLKTFPVCKVVEAAALAKEAGLARAVNMVMVGAASAFLPLKEKTLEKTIEDLFASKDASAVEANKKAFELGKNAAK
jgi:indolepyruvate ferredoxin oxidoreductase beta subunit